MSEPLIRRLATVSSREEVEYYLRQGFRIAVERGRIYLTKTTPDGVLLVAPVAENSDAEKYVREQLMVDRVIEMSTAAGYSETSTFLEHAYVYGAYAAVQGAIDELRRCLLDGMDPSYKRYFAFKSLSSDIYRESYRKGLFTRYALMPEAAKSARKILDTIIAFMSSQSTPSAIQAAIIAKLLLQMIKYDVVESGIEYWECMDTYKRAGYSAKEAEEFCSPFLESEGRWFVESLTGQPAHEDVMSFINELEADVAMALGESLWGDDVLRYRQIILWIYHEDCANCRAVMSTNAFREFVEVMNRYKEIPVFPISPTLAVSKTVIPHYLTIETLFFRRQLTTPVLVYYDLDERKLLIWSSDPADHKVLPIPEHIYDPPLVCAFLVCEERVDPSTGTKYKVPVTPPQERDDAIEVISRILFQQTLVVREGGTKTQMVARKIIEVLRSVGGAMRRKELVDAVAKELRVDKRFVGRVLNSMLGTRLRLEEGNVVVLPEARRMHMLGGE